MADHAEQPDENVLPEASTAEPAPDTSAPPLASMQAELTEARDKMLRAMAETENVRKRAERMQIDTTKFAVSGFARDLLDVADNLRRAIDSVPGDQRETETMKTLLQGIEATERVMLAAFERNGVRKVAPTQGKFDPNHHEAMFEADVPGKRQGEIIQLVEPGYVIHERLLRPARVGVAKGDPSMPAAHSLDEQV